MITILVTAALSVGATFAGLWIKSLLDEISDAEEIADKATEDFEIANRRVRQLQNDVDFQEGMIAELRNQLSEKIEVKKPRTRAKKVAVKVRK